MSTVELDLIKRLEEVARRRGELAVAEEDQVSFIPPPAEDMCFVRVLLSCFYCI